MAVLQHPELIGSHPGRKEMGDVDHFSHGRRLGGLSDSQVSDRHGYRFCPSYELSVAIMADMRINPPKMCFATAAPPGGMG